MADTERRARTPRCRRGGHGWCDRARPERLRLITGFVLSLVACAVSAQWMGPIEIREGDSAPFGPSVALGQFGHQQAVGDFDGDGFDDLAVSRAQGATANSDGLVHVLTGGPTGLTYSQTLAQFATDGFGDALAVCDLDGDGDDDLLVGAPDTAASGVSEAGVVFVHHGSPLGLSVQQTLDQDDLGLDLESNDEFGRTVVTGDFDADGACDVAIGSPGEPSIAAGGVQSAGLVSVVFGLGNGFLDPSSVIHLRERSLLAGRGSISSFDEFGAVLAARFGPMWNGRLLIGVPSKDIPHVNAGRVWLVEFNGRSVSSRWYVDPSDAGTLADNTDAFDEFGTALGLGSFLGGVPYAVIGTPGHSSASTEAIGAVFLLPISQFGSTQKDFLRLTQELPMFSNTPSVFEYFGTHLLVSDLDADGLDDLVVSAPNDLLETRGSSPPETGSVHVLPGSGSFGTAYNLLGSQIAAEKRGFGMALAAGNFHGDGGRALVVGAPRRNQATRGFDDTDEHGSIYLYRSLRRPTVAALGAREGGTAPDGSTYLEFSDAAATGAGLGGFRAMVDDGGGKSAQVRVVVDGQVVQRNDEVCAEGDGLEGGLAMQSSTIFGYIDRVAGNCADPSSGDLGLVSSAGFLATESTVVPGGAAGVPDRPLSSTDGRLYFLGLDLLGDRRILRTGPSAALPLEVVSAVGDSLGGGIFLKWIDRYDVSDDGSHHIQTGVIGAIADAEAVLLNGATILRPNDPISVSVNRGDPPPLIFSFRDVAVDDDANHLVAVVGTDGAQWLTYGNGGTLFSAVSSDSILGGRPLAGLEPKALSLSGGSGLHLWGPPVFNRGPGDTPLGNSGTALFVSCTAELSISQLVLHQGALVTIDGGPPAEVVSIHPPSGSEGLQLTAESHVFQHVRLARAGETFDAIVRVDVHCPLFVDGFESGNAENWN